MLINGNFEAENLMEANSEFVNRIYINYDGDTIAYNNDDKQTLQSVAYQYPWIGGDAVYRARAILNMDFDDTQVPYRYSDKSISNLSKLMVYPNPAKNAITVYYPIQDGENVTVEIYDPLGREVKKMDLTHDMITHSIPINTLISGLYSVRLNSNLGAHLSTKLTVIK
jgi:hypothetical protein